MTAVRNGAGAHADVSGRRPEAGPAPFFELRDHVSAGRRTLIVSGELDLVSSGRLESHIVRARADGVTQIALDLSGLTFIDSTGVRAILFAQETCREHGYEFLLKPGNRAVQRIFEIAGLLGSLPFTEPALRGTAEDAGEMDTVS